MEVVASNAGRRAVVGGNLRRARRRAGLTQAELAALLSVDRPCLSDWERGRHEPSWERLAEVAWLFGVRRAFFYEDR